ncbi:MAG: polysaccharide pyruvyl transferase family protein [Bacilli bacterium]
MKKVAIMTYHEMVNYGSFFQMYSLQQFIRSKKFIVKVINYRANASFITKFINNKSYLKRIWLKVNNKELWNKFNEFYAKHIFKTKMISSEKELKKLNKDFDIFVAGSDQIWSPNHYDIHYFLDFVDTNKRLISYAPSLVIDAFNKSTISILKKTLKKYKFISVREKTGQKILENSFGISSKVVLDPIFIVDIKELDRLINVSTDLNRYDCVCYFLGNNEYQNKVTNIFKNKKILNIAIDDSVKFVENEYVKNIDNADPGEFLSYLKNCNVICTDSYHGMVLALKYHKQFIIFDRFKSSDPICQNARIYDLLNTLEINDVNYNDFVKGKYKSINYDYTQNLLDKEIEKSVEFINKALGVKKN